jgi:hypothetical protein
MSALVSSGWESQRQKAQAMPALESSEASAIRERISIVRDTLLVLGLQLVFRATLIMRRWNY